jgi:hypothetical protein
LTVVACTNGSPVESKESSPDVHVITVLSTRDDSPIPGVTLRIRAVAKSLGEYGPEYDKQVWELTTDGAGEVRVKPAAGTVVRADVLASEGYTPMTGSVKSYENHVLKGVMEPDTVYLTPLFDVDYESIRYAYRTTSDVMDGKRLVGMKPIIHLVGAYSGAKKRAHTERELRALREFCRFSELLKAEAAKGWPTLGTSHGGDRVAQELIDDCISADAPASATEQQK